MQLFSAREKQSALGGSDTHKGSEAHPQSTDMQRIAAGSFTINRSTGIDERLSPAQGQEPTNGWPGLTQIQLTC